LKSQYGNLLVSNKLPEITLGFWAMKICATTLGETAGDHFSMTMNIGYAVSTMILATILIVALTFQLRARSYWPTLFWTVILLTSTAGTTMSDYMDRTLGLGYLAGSSLLITLLALILVMWRLTEGTLSVAQIKNRRGECFYWAAIIISNTLGTAFGDFLSDSTPLGFTGVAAILGAIILICGALYLFTPVSRILLFWTAFVLTRPFGAEVGNFFVKSVDRGGLNIGTLNTSFALFAILLCCVTSASMENKRRIEADSSLN
jgi:uncharacterized membrane-anchored protein